MSVSNREMKREYSWLIMDLSPSRRYAKTCRILQGSKPVTQGDSMASPASPVQAVGTKIIFLGSSKNEDYSDIDFIHYILVFRKTEIFSHVFSPAWTSIFSAKLLWKLSSWDRHFIFEEKSTIGWDIKNFSEDLIKCAYNFGTYFRPIILEKKSPCRVNR